MKDFVENDDPAFATQLNDFASGLTPTYGPLLGFSPLEITAAEDDAELFAYLVARQGEVQAYSEDFTGYKNLARYGSGTEVLPATIPVIGAFPVAPTVTAANIEDRFRKRAAKAKSSVNYTNSIGQTLRIVAPVEVFDPLLGKPIFKVFMDSGTPLLKWPKGKFQAVEIWADHGDGNNWRKQERDFKSPWVDHFPLPALGQSAVWKYKMIYVLNDATTGLWSDEVTVTVYGSV
ncbi:MAG TPA: hypothetical protein VI757_15050 [Bacteroidia bacterium]|nr:hypothetical protein [Bacteroidia bacterium]